MTEGFEFRDPHRRKPIRVTMARASELEVVRHQRKPRPAHLKQLVASIERLGFVTPLVVVERDGRYVIIDGQHRFAAGTQLGLREFPIIVVPGELARRMMSFNVEKDLNIRERCQIALSMYRELVEERPDLAESDGEVTDTVECAHYVTLGLAYEGNGRLAGGALEGVLKKCDGFLDEPLREALAIREGRAGRVLDAWKLVKAVEDALKERGLWHSMARYQIIASADPAKRARKPAAFDKAFPKFIANLEGLIDRPERVLGQRVSEE